MEQPDTRDGFSTTGIENKSPVTVCVPRRFRASRRSRPVRTCGYPAPTPMPRTSPRRPSRPTRTRVPNLQRSAATRARALDAAITCLAQRGYAGTNTVEICKRSGLARGSLLHHFHSRQSLVLAALDHLLDKRVAEFEVALDTVDLGDLAASGSGPPPIDWIIDQMWSVHRGPTFYAWLELLVASRTDAVLHRGFLKVMRRFEQRVAGIFANLLPAAAASPTARRAPNFAFSLMNGLGLDRIWKSQHEINEMIDVLKELGHLRLPPEPGRSPGR